MRNRARQIAISPFENADLSQFRDSLEAAARLYGLEPSFVQGVYFTSETSEIERRRRQRDAVLALLSAKKSLEGSSAGLPLTLLITNQDLFATSMNFVFGLANRDIGIAIMSTARLTQWVEDLTPSQIQERILKEAAHEIGHLLGLAHCERSSCLMSFSETLQKVDAKLPMLCIDCTRKLKGIR